MSLTPEHVLWNFVTATIVSLNVGLLWLVYPAQVHAVWRRLLLSDALAYWLGFAALYHTVLLWRGTHEALLGGDGGVWVVWGFLAVYLLLRLAPLPVRLAPLRLRRETLLLGLAITGWGWQTGAGYEFLARLEDDIARLRQAPQQVLTTPAPLPSPLARALTLRRLDDATRELLLRVLEPLQAAQPTPPVVLALARLELVPRLLAHYAEERSRLHAYQVIQILLGGAVLAIWGFGRPVQPFRGQP